MTVTDLAGADPLLNSAEAAMYLNVPMSTLRNRRREWGLNPFRTGRALQYRKSELDAWLEHTREVSRGERIPA